MTGGNKKATSPVDGEVFYVEFLNGFDKITKNSLN